MPGREVAVAGVHATRQAWRIDDVTPFELTWSAVEGALADAGLDRHEVDGAALAATGPGATSAGDPGAWAPMFGGPLAYVADGLLDAAGARGVLKAAAAISAGWCDVVVVGGASASGRRPPGTAPHAELALGPVGGRQGTAVGGGDEWGSYVAADFALLAARHAHEFGTRPEQLAAIAATIRTAGHANPAAILHGRPPCTVDDVLASRLVAEPLRLLDLCLVAEGGAAVVLTTVERARDLRQPVVRLLGGGIEVHGAAWAGPMAYRDHRAIGAAAGRRAFALAGVGPADVDLCCLYDPTSFEVLRQFEALGFCSEGDGGAFASPERIGAGGSLPTNPDGGCLAYAWNGIQQMTLKLVEAVVQLRGQAHGRQVEGCEVALATNGGAGAGHCEVAVLGRG